MPHFTPGQSFYEILGVDEKASMETIRIAYKKLALQYHPDKNPNGGEIFKKIQEAHAILSDENARSKYDYRRNQPKATTLNLSEEAKMALETLTMQICMLEKFYKSLNPKKSEPLFAVLRDMANDLRDGYKNIIEHRGNKKSIETALTNVINSAEEKTRRPEVRKQTQFKSFFTNLIETIKSVLHKILPNAKLFNSNAQKTMTKIYNASKKTLDETVKGGNTERGNTSNFTGIVPEGQHSNTMSTNTDNDVKRLTGKEPPKLIKG